MVIILFIWSYEVLILANELETIVGTNWFSNINIFTKLNTNKNGNNIEIYWIHPHLNCSQKAGIYIILYGGYLILALIRKPSANVLDHET